MTTSSPGETLSPGFQRLLTEINASPGMISALYDLNLLPEQVDNRPTRSSRELLIAFAMGWKARMIEGCTAAPWRVEPDGCMSHVVRADQPLDAPERHTGMRAVGLVADGKTVISADQARSLLERAVACMNLLADHPDLSTVEIRRR
jgi:hypothetical protein